MNDTCDIIRPLISGAIDGELAPLQQDTVDSHLAQCAECRAHRAELSHVDRRLNDLFAAVGPDAMDIQAIRDVARHASRRARFHAKITVRRVALIAALILIGCVIGLLVDPPTNPDVPLGPDLQFRPVVTVGEGEIFPFAFGDATRGVVEGPAVLSGDRGLAGLELRDIQIDVGTLHVEHLLARPPLRIRFPAGELALSSGSVSIEVGLHTRETELLLYTGTATMTHEGRSSLLVPGRRMVLASSTPMIALNEERREIPTETATETTLLVGTVTDTDGTPVGGAQITIQCRQSHWRFPKRDARTDASGHFTLEVPEGTHHHLDIGATERTVSRRVSFPVPPSLRGGQITQSFQVSTGGKLLGRVVDMTGEPVEGAEVVVRSRSEEIEGHFPWVPESLRTTRSGADGTFSIDHVGPRYTISARSDRHAPFYAHHGLIPDRRTHRGLELTVASAGSIRGTVRTHHGEPIADAIVHVSVRDTDERIAKDTAEVPPRLPSTLTDKNGAFRIDDLPVDVPLVVRSDKKSYLPQERSDVVLSIDTALELPFTLERGANLEGIATDPSGAPIPFLLINILTEVDGQWIKRFPPTHTDGKGRFSVTSLRKGRVILAAHGQGFGPGLVRAEVLDSETPVEPAHLILPQAATMVGRLSGPDGSPLKEALVEVLMRDLPVEGLDASVAGDLLPGTIRRHVQTRSDGSFSISELAEVPYVVRVTPYEGQLQVRSGNAASEFMGQPGVPIDRRIEAMATTTELNLDVRAAHTGKPLGAFRVLYRFESEGLSLETAQTLRQDDVRPARIQGLVGETSTVEISAHGFAARTLGPLTLEGPEDSLVVDLEPGGTLTGRVVDAGGRALSHLQIAFFDKDGDPISLRVGPERSLVKTFRTRSSSEFTIYDVPAEEVVLRVNARDSDTEKRVHLARGERRELTIVVE